MTQFHEQQMGREINLESILVLEKQIKEHENTLIRLKRLRNSLLNVSTLLPPEILGNIFRWNAIPDPGDFGGLPKGSYNFFLVCHHWFEVASRTPELWSFWGNSIQDWAHRHARSGTAPLDLVLGKDTGRALDDRLRDALKDRAARDAIRRVHLRATNVGPINSVISAIVAGGEGTRLSSVESFVVQKNGKTWDMPDVSAFFSKHRLLKLQRLCLYYCRISSWDLLKSQTGTLTTLELTVGESSSISTLSQLLEILSSNPLLQHLTLYHTGGPSPADSGRTSPLPVPLRRLKEIKLTSGFFHAFELLNRLELPDKMDNVTLALYECPPSDISQTLGPYIGDRVRRGGVILDGPGGLGFRTNIASSDCLDFCVGWVYERGDPDKFVPFVEVSVRLSPSVEPVGEEEANRLYFDLIAHIPLGQVISLKTTLPILRSKELCIGMSNLAYLHLPNVDLSTWFIEPDISGAHTPNDILSGLGSLEVSRSTSSGGWGAFTNFLSRRAAAGNRIHSLLLYGCRPMGQDVVESIKRAVDIFDDRGGDYHKYQYPLEWHRN